MTNTRENTLPLLDQARSALNMRELDRALRLFNEAEDRGADADQCAAGRWQTSMLTGQMEDAWRESDSLRRRETYDPHRLWNGEALETKRVLVRCLHGMGDAIQFLRYAPRLRSMAAELTVQVPPHFMALASCIDGVGTVTTWDELTQVDRTEWDVQLEVMQIPYIFRCTIPSLPLPIPYLQVPSINVSSVAERMKRTDGGERPRIGICWSCGDWNLARSIPQHLFERLIGDICGSFYSLQLESPCMRLSHTRKGTYYDANTFGVSPLALAAVIANLDLIVTVDTMAAHIAGALGKPVWLLLPYAADWRWMHKRDDSPWYPSMRIFRQPQPRDWAAVIGEVSGRLASYEHLKEDPRSASHVVG